MPHPSGHLRRLDRVWSRSSIYFITTCVQGRQPILATAASHEILRTELAGINRRHGWLVGQYVAMPDHFHFIAHADEERAVSLSRMMGSWKEWTAKRINSVTDRTGRLWQAEFFDHLVRSDESLDKRWEYVRENPVRAKLVTRWEDWPYTGVIDFDL